MDVLTGRRRVSWRRSSVWLVVLVQAASLASLSVTGLLWSQGPVLHRSAPGARSLEYQIKAAYLLNFTRYVDWPSEAYGAPGAPLTVCVLGRDPFGEILDATMQGKTTHGRPVSVRRIQSSGDASGCHLVFVSQETWQKQRQSLQSLDTKGILTVGETDEFAQRGGVIGFVIQEETVRFVVNTDARDRAGLRISSRMLSLAAAVYGERPT